MILKKFDIKIIVPLIIGLIFVCYPLHAKPSGKGPVPAVALAVAPTVSAPSIDGKLDEAIWKKAVIFSDFKTMYPDFGQVPSEETQVLVTYDRTHLYFGIRGMDKETDKIKASLSRRDNLGNDDWVAIELDTFNDGQFNYFFMVNPLGIQADGTIGMYETDDFSPDSVWYSKGRLNKDGYTIEISIPFKSLRIPAGKKVNMGLGIRRSISRKSEILAFPEYSPNRGSRLTQRQKISILNIKRHRVIEILPAFTYGGNSSRQSDGWTSMDTVTDAGVTAKLGITPTLTLETTYNPDFSHIESDAGMIDINLRSPILYTEKRPFFMEGQEIYNFAGKTPGYAKSLSTVVNTRTIINPMLGVKLNGKLGQKNFVSALFALDETPYSGAEPNTGNYSDNAAVSILRYKRSLSDDGYLGGLYTGRLQGDAFNHVAGVDGKIRLNGKARIGFHAFGSQTGNGAYTNNLSGSALAFEYDYKSKNLTFDIGLRNVSKDFRTETGHLQRSGITKIPLNAVYSIKPKSSLFQKISFKYYGDQTLDRYSNKLETLNWLGVQFELPRQSRFYIGGNYKTENFSGKHFNASYLSFGVDSQILKQLFFKFSGHLSNLIYYDYDNPFQGKGHDITARLIFQPFSQLKTSLDLKYDIFYRSSNDEKIYEYTILRSRTTYQFNKYLYLRGIVEYNSYRKNIDGEFLLSFTYIPGTVVQAGYGAQYHKGDWVDGRYIPVQGYHQIKRNFFFKISYNWRL